MSHLSGKGRIDEIGYTRRYFPEAPDLVVEVISPNDRYADVDEKVADWLGAGVQMVIVVNERNHTSKVHTPTGMTTLSEADMLTGGNVAPGWSMPVADIFA